MQNGVNFSEANYIVDSLKVNKKIISFEIKQKSNR